MTENHCKPCDKSRQADFPIDPLALEQRSFLTHKRVQHLSHHPHTPCRVHILVPDAITNRSSREARKALPNPSGAPIRTTPETTSPWAPRRAMPSDKAASARLGSSENLLAVLSQKATTRIAIQQSSTAPLFERSKRTTQKSLTDTESARRSKHRAVARDGQKIPCVIPVQLAIFA